MIEWKPIEGYEGLYEVSNLGQVRSLNYRRTGETKILKPGKQRGGYLHINLYKNGKHYTKTVHRLVAVAFIPNTGDKLQVNHIDGDKTNNKVDNLEWVTGKENCQHAYNAGLHKPIKHTEERKRKLSEALKGKLAGEKNPMYGKHHTEETKRKISETHKGKYTGEKHPQAKRVICVTTGETFNYIREGAKKYNVAHQHISKCCKGKIKSAGKLPTGEKLVWRYMDI